VIWDVLLAPFVDFGFMRRALLGCIDRVHGICPKRRNKKDEAYNRKCLRVSLQKWEPDSHFWNSLFLWLLRYVREPDVLAVA
jgi:hypothetical protein